MTEPSDELGDFLSQFEQMLGDHEAAARARQHERLRPKHPDMRLLMDLILQIDGQATEGGLSVADIVGPVVDLDSINYLAANRVVHADRITGGDWPDPHQRFLAMAVGLYLEAFTMGVRYAARRAE